jgi:hypothetical protein
MSGSDLLNKLLDANKLSNAEAKAAREAEIERKRHEMAGTMTRMMLNEALGRVKQTKQENEALAARQKTVFVDDK